jgi:hypothetical protein
VKHDPYIHVRKAFARDVDICRERGWVAGDRLSGREDSCVTVIELRFIGETMLIAKRVRENGKVVDGMENGWTLGCRKWRRVRKSGQHKRPTQEGESK